MASTPNGMPHARTIDAAGLNNAALRITGSDNQVHGLRIANSGGDSDTLLIDGPEANGNLIDDRGVAGRAMQPCQVGDVIGCVLDGVCVVPTAGAPRGACGDDGIAVRDFAGAVTPNVVRDADVRGAHDKGIKASYNGVVRVETLAGHRQYRRRHPGDAEWPGDRRSPTRCAAQSRHPDRERHRRQRRRASAHSPRRGSTPAAT